MGVLRDSLPPVLTEGEWNKMIESGSVNHFLLSNPILGIGSDGCFKDVMLYS